MSQIIDRFRNSQIERVVFESIQKAGNARKLASFLGASSSTVNNWTRGGIPGSDFLLKMITFIGGNFDRAMPEFDDAEMKDLKIYGNVSAGHVSYSEEAIKEISGPAPEWKASAFRNLTTGSPIYLEVRGNSMEPDYPDGCLLACARPSARQLPNLTPVIARVGDLMTFKLYKFGKDRKGRPEVELIPINRSFNVQRYDPRDVAIDYVALGFINPWVHGVDSGPRSPILKDSN